MPSERALATPRRPAAKAAQGCPQPEIPEGRRRVVIENVRPQVEGGRYPAKAALGEPVRVEADIFADGHDEVSAELLHRGPGEQGWTAAPLGLDVNDHWLGEFPLRGLGLHSFTVNAWVDHFKTWRHDLAKRVEAGQDVAADLRIGAALVAAAVDRASGEDAAALDRYARLLRSRRGLGHAMDSELELLMAAHPDRRLETRLGRELEVRADPALARFGAWYELFPRSASPEPGRPGTLRDVEALVPRIAGMGFDVLYLPPIHPIGTSFRKGRNNTEGSRPGDPGSPWAIGSEKGGHKSIHPELGTPEDFRSLVRSARAQGVEVALDIAFQCSPDHPYVREHPQWFRHRPDGSVQYAENPPKKYQDIFPFDFETEDWRALWAELLSVFAHWCEEGVRVFRVDNPHTKPFAFWEWLVGELKGTYPDAILLSEAFTRPRVMYRLAKLGFTQSYTYFAWRTTSAQLREYLTELTATPVADFFRPNLWPNTPDILAEPLPSGGRAAFISRLVLAATLGASYGVYGPPYELMEREPLEPGKEEYLNSEKYEIRRWDLDGPEGLGPFMSRLNAIRHAHPALQTDRTLRFARSDNEQILPYLKQAGADAILTVVNLDPHHTQSGWIEVPVAELGIGPDASYAVRDLLGDATYVWRGAWNYVELNPHATPAHVLHVEAGAPA